MEYDQIKELIKTQNSSNKIDFQRIVRIISKWKYILILSFLIIFSVGYYYLKTAAHIYESTVLLKKEGSKDNAQRDDPYLKLIALQSQDDITTEMALIKTKTVLDGVIKKLNLDLSIDKIVTSDDKTIEVNKTLAEYNLSFGNDKYTIMPQFLSFQADSLDNTMNLVLIKDDNGYLLYKTENKKNIFAGLLPNNNPIKINTLGFQIIIYWPGVSNGSKLYFTIYNNASAYLQLSNNINVSQKEETNLLEISVKDKNPDIAQLIASTLVDKFKESRTDQQRWLIHESYASIDTQLNETSQKLKDAENKLSDYQSSTGIANLDKNSSDLVGFLSNLEAEKIDNDLKLGELVEKENQLLKVSEKKGYFDESYLSPSETNNGGGNAFSAVQNQLSTLEVRRIELLQKETESHPDVISIDNQIAQLKKQLSNYNQNTLTAYKVMISSLQQKKKNLENLINQYQGKVQGLPGKETKLVSLMRDKDVYFKIFNLLLDKREELRVKEIAQFQDISVVDPATLPIFPVSPNKYLTAVICLFVWCGVLMVLIFIGINRDTRFLQLDQIEKDLKLPLLSIIPKYSTKLKKKLDNAQSLEERFAVLSTDNVGIIESYKVLQTKLNFELENKSKVIMFTSCEEHSGKTTIISNLALSLINADKKILIIDGDLKRCTLSDMFDIPRNSPGLTSFLERDLQNIPVKNLSNVFGRSIKEKLLNLLPAGDVSENSSELLQSAKFLDLINMLKASFYDYILIDTPPITRVIDSLVLGRIINNVILIVRDNFSLKESVEEGLKEFKNENINIIGVIANGFEIEKSSYKHRYGYGYGYKYAYEPNKFNKKNKKFNKQITIV
ncbi:MAG: polysaccharide biosynthesis tyrosine autokinase [Ignavibacteriaceae bacterium]|nr:polysaccharide biosynthesis tyrosine autokinase [Ignavibacteriaceae bacterium]